MLALLGRLKKFADRRWYAPLIGVLAGADQFIVIVPIEALMIPSVLLNPKRWFWTAISIATGCTVGAMLLATFAGLYGMPLLEHWAPHVLHTHNWIRSMNYINDKGAWALFVIAVGPLPQQPAVALAGLSHMPLFKVFLAVWLGRAIKYSLIAFIVSHAPRFAARIFPSSALLQTDPKGDPKS